MTHLSIRLVLAAAAAFSTGALAQPKPPADKAPDATGASDKPHATIESFHAQCIGCPGIPGYKTGYPLVSLEPRIAGQHPGYIIASLKAYKSGERSPPSMLERAASMSDEHMQKL